MTIPEYILVVANSARMLAEAARKTRINVLAIDLYGDLDLQAFVCDSFLVKSLSVFDLAPAIDYFVQKYAVENVVYGSGFENFPESLVYLQTKANILGNPPGLFMKLQDKQQFFAELDRLEIKHPEVRFHAPAPQGHWLVKPLRGQGGYGIKHLLQSEFLPSSEVYWQKYQPGVACSVLFIANGSSFEVIGFNKQWTRNEDDEEPFIFSGIINHTALSTYEKIQITDWLQRFVDLYALKGLNSLDFIQHKQRNYVLEINPRPSASMQLYEGNLFLAHIHACLGGTLVSRPHETGFKGYQIVYAQKTVTIPELFEWPNGCIDLPVAGSIIGVGHPICSMIAHHNDVQDVMNQLIDKQNKIINQLERFQSYAI